MIRKSLFTGGLLCLALAIPAHSGGNKAKKMKSPAGWSPGSTQGMQGMLQQDIYPMEDGGIVVSMGDMIFRYDKKLNLVGKTQVPVDEAALQKHAARMHRMHILMLDMDEGMSDGGMGDGMSPQADQDEEPNPQINQTPRKDKKLLTPGPGQENRPPERNSPPNE